MKTTLLLFAFACGVVVYLVAIYFGLYLLTNERRELGSALLIILLGAPMIYGALVPGMRD